LGHAAAEAIGRWLAVSKSWSVTGLAWESTEGSLLALIVAIGAATCVIPAIQAYLRDPATVLLEQ
jgi:hypothetical protein